jgi:hypothetical protein
MPMRDARCAMRDRRGAQELAVDLLRPGKQRTIDEMPYLSPGSSLTSLIVGGDSDSDSGWGR